MPHMLWFAGGELVRQVPSVWTVIVAPEPQWLSRAPVTGPPAGPDGPLELLHASVTSAASASESGASRRTAIGVMAAPCKEAMSDGRARRCVIFSLRNLFA